MASKSSSVPSPIDGDMLDRLFLDCLALETSIASISQAIDRLAPAVECGLVTAEHLMSLVYRIETAERGMIKVADRLGDTATSLIDRRRMATSVH